MSTIYNVSFPKIGINLKINPIAINIGNISVRWYGIFIAIGFAIGLIYILKRCNDFDLKKSTVENVTAISFILAIIFARLYYVIFYPGDYYIKHPFKIFCVNEGGIAIYGAIIGSVLGILLTSKILKQDLPTLLDLMSLGMPIGQAIGRWGNFTNQEAFGCVTTMPWGMISENTYGLLVHPCFLYESIGCIACFLFLHFYSYKKTNYFRGKIFLMYLLFYSMIRAVIEGFRSDSLIIPSTNLKVSQILAIILALFSFILIKINNKKILKNKA